MGTQLPSLCWGLLFWTQPFYKATNWDGKRMILVVFSESTVPSKQAKLCSTIQVRPVILNARCRLLTILSCHPWCCFRVRASLRLSWPASAITVRILGNNALNPLSRAPGRRSDVSADSTRLPTSRPRECIVRSLWPRSALFQERRQLFKHPLTNSVALNGVLVPHESTAG